MALSSGLTRLTETDVVSRFPAGCRRLVPGRDFAERLPKSGQSQVLGRGGQGTVRRGVLLPDETEVALKFYELNPKNIEDFVREVTFLHQHAATAKDRGMFVKLNGFSTFETKKGRVVKRMGVVVMELVRDGALSTWAGQLSPENRYRCLIGVTQGLEVVHTGFDRPYIYRDLKPDNLLCSFDDDGRLMVKLCDFGLTRSLSTTSIAITVTSTSTTTTMMNENTNNNTSSCLLTQGAGTRGFKAPEVGMATAQRQYCEYGVAVDVYSLGVLGFYLLGGELPFGFIELRTRDHRVDDELIDLIPVEWRSLLLSCLEFDPNKRPSISGLLREMLAVDSGKIIEQIRRALPIVQANRAALTDKLLHGRPDHWARDGYQFSGRLLCDLPSAETILMRNDVLEALTQLLFASSSNTRGGGPSSVASSPSSSSSSLVISLSDSSLVLPMSSPSSLLDSLESLPSLRDSSSQANVSNRHRGVAICGMGGMGKTVIVSVLLSYLAHRQATKGAPTLQQRFPDGVLSLSVGQAASDADIVKLQQLVCRFCLASQPEERQIERLNAIDKLQSVKDGQQLIGDMSANVQMLLVLDNVWIERDLQAFNGMSSECRIICTTRNSEIASGYHIYKLSPLSVEDAKCLLMSNAMRAARPNLLEPADQHAAAIDQLTRRCAGHPLMLNVIGSMCGQPSATFSTVATQLWRTNLDGQEEIKNKCLGALQLSVDALHSDHQRRLFELAVLAPQVRKVAQCTIDLLWQERSRLEGMEWSSEDTERVLELLANRSLINLVHLEGSSNAIEDRRFTTFVEMHDLIRELIDRGNQVALSELHESLLEGYRSSVRQVGDFLNDEFIEPDGYFYQHAEWHFNQIHLEDARWDCVFEWSPRWIDTFIRCQGDATKTQGGELPPRHLFDELVRCIRRFPAFDWPSLLSNCAASSQMEWEDPMVQQFLIPLISEPRTTLQAAGIGLLGLVIAKGDPFAVPSLLEMLDSTDSNIRHTLCNALGEIALPGDQLVISAVVACLFDPRCAVRSSACHALQCLADQGDNDVVEPLLSVLCDDSPDVRQGACRALGSVADPEGSEILVKLLSILYDSDSDVCASACMALEQIATKGNQEVMEKVSSGLSSALLDPVCKFRHHLGQTLNAISTKGDQQAISIFLELLNTPTLHDSDPLIALAALRDLPEKGDQRVISSLLPFLRHPDPDFRQEIISVLGEITERGDRNVISAFLGMLSDPDLNVHIDAYRGLRKIALRGDQVVIRALIGSLADLAPEIRKRACRALENLAKKGDREVIGALLVVLCDPSPKVRKNACVALAVTAQRGNQDVIEALLPRCHDPDDQVRLIALVAVQHVADKGNQEIVATLLGALDGPDSEAACEALGEVAQRGDQNVVAALLVRLNDPESDAKVRANVCAALGKVAKKGDPDIIATLLIMLEDTEDDICLNVCSALGQLAEQGNRDVISALLVKLNNTDSDPKIRKNACSSLGLVAEKGDQAIMAVLLATLDDSNSEIHENVCDALGNIALNGDQDVIATLLAIFGDTDPETRAKPEDFQGMVERAIMRLSDEHNHLLDELSSEPVRRLLREGCCTLAATGEDLSLQRAYRCITCNYPMNHILCGSCLALCHTEHQVEPAFGFCFCDCPDRGQCLAVSASPASSVASSST